MSNSIQSILIVDDDPIQIKLVEKYLSEESFKLYSSTDAAEGLQKAMDLKPDLILLDVMMPIINGYNFCKTGENRAG
jgi:CheY-like chemotaxis protein